MVAFTLVNCGNSGGFYVGSHHEAMGWQGLPRDLVREMEDVRRKGEEVQQLSTGLDGDWFLRTNKRLECKADERRQFSNVKLFIQLKQKAGFSPQHYTIQFFTFVPDSMGYVAGMHKTDGSITHCAWRNVPQKLDTVLEREANIGVRHVAVGKNGSFVVILKNGIMFWSGVPESLSQKLDSAKREGLAMVTVSLSLISDSWYFVEFEDGATHFCLPPDWHASINKYTAEAMRIAKRVKTTSVLSSTHSPDPGQIGSFNPASLYPEPMPSVSTSNPTSASAPTPRQPEFATRVHNNPTPQKEPVSTGIQQPVYSKHLVPVNTAPVQGTPLAATAKDYNGLITLAGGTFKLASAVIKEK